MQIKIMNEFQTVTELMAEWHDINLNRNKLRMFMVEYEVATGRQRENMERFLLSFDTDRLQRLLDGDEDESRMAYIETLAREAAAEMVTIGQYSKETFRLLFSLPISDFRLVNKRVQELVYIAHDVTNQVQSSQGLAGA